MNIAFIPIDNRPVCYTLAKQISNLNDEIKLFLPDRKVLGSLKDVCDIDKLYNWLENLHNIDIVIASLDTIAYGGLISSRRSKDDFYEIKNRLERFKKLVKGKKIYAFSSIMRISNNNINEEEKSYWKDYGKRIFEYSYNLHKNKISETDIPKEILQDYLDTRKRNFEINKLYLEWQKESFFEKLIFSKDDCAQFGLNVMEAEDLAAISKQFGEKVLIKTGADEIPLSLLARAINDYRKTKIKIKPIFLEDEYKNLISNYEDISIDECVHSQMELAGCYIANNIDEADIILYVNNFKICQGELVMNIDTEHYKGNWERPEKPYAVADVRFANGADNAFVEKLLDVGLGQNFLGYAGWNTSANTLGSLICSIVAGYNRTNNEEFNRLEVTRFLDDWAYQANVRKQLEKPDMKMCKTLMKPYEDKICKIFNSRYDISYNFPWERLFEIEINIE